MLWDHHWSGLRSDVSAQEATALIARCVCSNADSVFKRLEAVLFAGKQQKKRMCV